MMPESESFEIPAREGAAFKLRAGDRIKLISPRGQQVADFFAFNADDPSEYLSMRTTVASGTRNPSRAALTFPFVAFPGHGRVLVWGRTPQR